MVFFPTYGELLASRYFLIPETRAENYSIRGDLAIYRLSRNLFAIARHRVRIQWEFRWAIKTASAEFRTTDQLGKRPRVAFIQFAR